MRKIVSVIFCGFLIICLSACGSSKIACIKGPTGVGMVKLMEDASSGNSDNEYSFMVVSSADEISAKIISGEINIASVPTNLAVKLYNKTGGKIRMLAINTLGVLSVIANMDGIDTFTDLKGKTIYSTGENSNPEYILKYLLKQNGLTIGEDVQIQFVATNDELVACLLSGKAEVAVVPEPAATTVLAKSDSLKRVLSINQEWEKVNSDGLMMGCVVALDNYVKENKEAVEMFLKEYENSINYAKENVTEAAALCEKYEIVPSAAIAEKAIPECNLTFISGKEMEKITSYFEVLKAFDMASIGGKMPGKDFFYKAE